MRYLSQCPSCQTVYQLSLMELNITQGMVRCAHCHHIFDAYSCFIEDPEYSPPSISSYITEMLIAHQHNTAGDQLKYTALNQRSDNPFIRHVNQLMSQSVDGSQLNLYTYLNYLDTLSPIHSIKEEQDIDAVKMAEKQKSTFVTAKPKKKSVLYYLGWGVIHVFLISLLLYQIIFFHQ
ncbi:MAG: zinc-ribbon domain-containing protein [Acinetobacter populi]|uniref:zinc-ribbon domain-containing protein n=1 Tax=Acinetobacter populi TaxID=1582270 RepID=UPI00235491BD|nr:zinc-ribbon domain-containing protein [Acinetobacter populi]MCH4246267.1 zinc-ribbon domain-containing protein [Acinetobacter populi]